MICAQKMKYRILLLLLIFAIGTNAQNIEENNTPNTIDIKDTIVEVLQDTLVKPKTTIVSYLSHSKEHSIFLRLLKLSGVDAYFSTELSSTLFAPTNAGFEKLPKGTLENLMLPENKYKLINILNYHIVLGSINTVSMLKTIESNKGKAKLKTASGGVITIFIKQSIFAIEGNEGRGILIESPDKLQTDGIIHIVDSVLIPN